MKYVQNSPTDTMKAKEKEKLIWLIRSHADV